jgi:hypothetical protein
VIIKRIDPISYAKVQGVLCALLGLIFGIGIALIGMVGGSLGGGGMLRGLGLLAIIVVPILYGLFGFIATIIAALLFNMAAGWVGGIKLDVE